MHGVTETCSNLLAQSALLSVWSSTWPYLVMLLGFSAIIFVHELGHFMVAKWAGVRVEKFAIGFGKELFGFTRGETRYCFNLLPLGGYVKMLGQEDFDDKSEELKFKDDPRSFVNKPVGHRMAIVSAGVVMNVLFACVLFMIVFQIGLDSPSTRVASVMPDSPAEQAGLLPGDIVREVRGRSVLSFEEITASIFLAPPHEPIDFLIERDGQRLNLDIEPEYRQAEFTKDLQRQVVGIGPGVTREIAAVGPDFSRNRENRPRVGDLLVEVDGIEVTDENASRIQAILGYLDGDIVVERKDPNDEKAPPRRLTVSSPPQLAFYPSDSKDASSVSLLGLTPLVRFDGVDPSGRAALAGIEIGDTILAWDDEPNPSRAEVSGAVRDNAERDIAYRIRKPDGQEKDGFVRPKRNKRGPGTIHAVCKSIPLEQRKEGGPQARFETVRPGGAAARAGVEEGDAVLGCNDIQLPSTGDINKWVRDRSRSPVNLQLIKQDGRRQSVMVTPEAPGSIDATFALVADDVLRVGKILSTINDRTTPAAASGIPDGSTIQSVNGGPVSRWRELISALRENAGTTVQLGYLDAKGAARTAAFEAPHCLRTMLGVGPEARVLRIDGRETVNVKKSGGEQEISVRYHEGTRAVLQSLVGQKNVPVEFRANLLSDIQTKYIDVTEDMVDPWLGRVALAANLDLGPELIKLKGKNAFDAVGIGIHKTYYFMVQVYEVLNRMIFSRSVSVESVSGPLGIIDIGGAQARAGTVRFLFFMAIISANLAVINFLPLPIVDGGLMVFLLIEKIKGSPVSLRVQIVTQMIGIFLIIGAFLFVTYNDAVRLWG